MQVSMIKNDKNVKKPNIQKDILKFLAEKPAVPVKDIIKENLPEADRDPKKNYALARSIKNLVEAGLVEIHSSDNQKYLKITKKGRGKLNCIRLEGEEALVSNAWDGFWRIIILDIPEERKSEREALRYLLKKANFICVKNTVWISPYPYEHLFKNIKKDLGLGTELMILVTDKLDEETNLAFLKKIKD
jgi:DNA-binding transcriptional regulator PaaX